MIYTPITHILVIDDDDRIRSLLAKYLHDNGFFISVAENADAARTKMSDYNFDLLILDVMMPGETGIEFIKYLRSNKIKIPVIMLTAMGETEDRITGLESGADDYLPKPFEPKELLLRIKNILQRTTKVESNIIKIGNFEYNPLKMDLCLDGEIIPLTSNEASLMKILTKNMGEIVTRDELAGLLGGINERSVDVQITRLRNKIENDPANPRFLKTVRGKGYILYGE